jgi:methylated-DNA-[protein]-cysteine S-methyltransferase
MTLGTIEVPSPMGGITLVLRGAALCALAFTDGFPRVAGVLRRRFGEVALGPADDPDGVVDRLARYFAGDLAALDAIAVDPGGTPFQCAVWAALRTVPAGRTISYRDLARAIGAPAAVRAVGAANGANPVGIVIPCHRAVGADGSLTGYGGGLERKRWLLAHERVAPFDVVSRAAPR